MPKISKKGEMMPASPIRKLVPFADAAVSRGVKVFYLNIGQPDIETPKGARDAVKNADIKVIAYSHSAGNLSYRKKLVEYYHKVGIELTTDEIIVTTGGSEGIQFAFNSCLDAGDEVIIPEPFYANYNGFAVTSGVVVKPIVSKIENGFALPPIEEFEKVITPKTKAIMICNPSNPTGYLYSKEELITLSKIVEKYDLFLFADEVYREFTYDGEEHFSVMEMKNIEQNTILLDSVSKRYSACGVRIGAFISKNKEVMATAMKFAQARLSPPTYGQILGEAAVDTPQEYFDEVIAEYVERRDAIVNAINDMPGCYCPNPKGAFYCVARLPIDNSDRFCQWLLEEFNHNGKTVMMAPATGFYSHPTQGTDEVRISYCLKVDDLKEAMVCLAEALKVYPGRK
ncbi:pyridoxal phosphate-dependent aminotransferase [Bacteroidales bacterium OttesenSCG-928-B11]|nr:pyridoxal phosphate-dependent aminotransferase [Bacteroidales bacterium OttesenSCG-928-C03]MDL2312035.1 pyridoxal phosphate-dependent aminotransferase [Bacteroidales bacterium OttesenSCG-928-B11]